MTDHPTPTGGTSDQLRLTEGANLLRPGLGRVWAFGLRRRLGA